MISKAEREHLNLLERWSTESRAALRELQAKQPLFAKLLNRINASGQNHELVFDNVDWLLALIKRELHTKGVKDLLKAVERSE